MPNCQYGHSDLMVSMATWTNDGQFPIEFECEFLPTPVTSYCPVSVDHVIITYAGLG